jgi:hypothetical protein
MNKLGLKEFPYDAIFQLSLAFQATRHIAEMAKAGKKILILCFSRELSYEIRDRFLAEGCATYLIDDGVEIGQSDPDI